MGISDGGDLQGRTVLITGANTGIGRVTARELVRRGAHVFLACRSVERAQSALTEIGTIAGAGRAELLSLDLADFGSIRQCAQSFLARGLPLHVLINNAGVARTRGRTASGFEFAFGVNHIGHFLLSQLLLPCLVASAPARIVTVASRAHYRAKGIDWQAVCEPTRSFTGLPEYAVSKLANVLFSAQLGRLLAGTGVSTYSLHPGVVATDVWRNVPPVLRQLIKLAMRTPEQGAATSLYCATSPQLGQETGLYYDDCAVRAPSELAGDPELAADLWRRSEHWVQSEGAPTHADAIRE